MKLPKSNSKQIHRIIRSQPVNVNIQELQQMKLYNMDNHVIICTEQNVAADLSLQSLISENCDESECYIRMAKCRKNVKRLFTTLTVV